MTFELQNPVAATFSSHVNTRFRLAGTPSAELELVGVLDRSTPQHINFSLVFRGPHQPLLQQRIYSLEHDALGCLDLFIVPVKRDAQGLQYEAIFNRMNESAATANESR